MEEFSWDFLKKILYFCHDKMILHGGEKDGSTEPAGSSASIHTSQKRITYNLEK